MRECVCVRTCIYKKIYSRVHTKRLISISEYYKCRYIHRFSLIKKNRRRQGLLKTIANQKIHTSTQHTHEHKDTKIRCSCRVLLYCPRRRVYGCMRVRVGSTREKEQERGRGSTHARAQNDDDCFYQFKK